MRYIKQSTSVDLPIGPFLDSADGFTAMTALTLTQPDIRLKKNGGAWAQKNAAQTLSHEENGWYEVTLDTTDTNTLGQLMLAVNESGALPVWHEFTVLAANVYDSLIGGGDLLDVNTSQAGGTDWASGAITAASVAADTGTEIATAVWASGTRVLTAGTNIALAKGTGVTGFNDLSAADVRTAVGLASANLDTQLGDLPTNAELTTALSPIALEASVVTIDGNVDAIKAKTDSLTFTVAGQVDANAESMNGTEILGNGSSGDLWRGS